MSIKKEELIYFIDYNEDEVVPVAANAELVKRYDDLKEKLDEPIETFKSKEDLLNTAIEYAHQARHDSRDFEVLSDEDILDWIKEAKEQLEELKTDE